jgi:uroporphyrinogen-III synthase
VDELDADFVALYRTVPAAPAGGLPAGEIVVLASPSAARVLGDVWAAAPPDRRPLVVSIGPQTSLAARAAGLEVAVEARHFDLDGLQGAIEVAAGKVAEAGGAA